MPNQELLNLIDEDIDVLRETLSNFERMKDSNPDKKYFTEQTKRDIDWMLKFKDIWLN